MLAVIPAQPTSPLRPERRPSAFLARPSGGETAAWIPTISASSETISIAGSTVTEEPVQSGYVWTFRLKRSLMRSNDECSSRMLKDKEKRKRLLQRIRVPLGFAMAIVLVLFGQPTSLPCDRILLTSLRAFDPSLGGRPHSQIRKIGGDRPIFV